MLYTVPMTTTTSLDLILSATTTAAQAAAVRRVAWRAESDLGAEPRLVAYNMDPLRGYVTLGCEGYEVVVLVDGTIAEEAPA